MHIFEQSVRCVMKYARFLVLPLLLVGFSALAYADGVPVDPQMDVSDPTCTTTSCPNPVGFGLGFQFTVNAQGGGIFMATNQSATTDSSGKWNSLLFTFMSPLVSIDSVSCTSGLGGNAPFGSPCTKTQEQNGTIDLLYSVACTGDTEICTSGIPNNDIFTINLNAIIPGDIWPAGLTFNAYPNANKNVSGFVILTETVPEPGTITLLGAGLVALVAKRRFRRQLQARS
jgi:hypothetical protein